MSDRADDYEDAFYRCSACEYRSLDSEDFILDESGEFLCMDHPDPEGSLTRGARMIADLPAGFLVGRVEV